jgi:hypothetical protein
METVCLKPIKIIYTFNKIKIKLPRSKLRGQHNTTPYPNKQVAIENLSNSSLYSLFSKPTKEAK